MSGSSACRKAFAGVRCGLPKGHAGAHELRLCIASVVDPDLMHRADAPARPCKYRQAPGSELCSVHTKALKRAMEGV